MKQPPKDFAGRLAFTREERGLTQAELAKLVGTSERTVRRWENSDVPPPPLETVKALAKALGGVSLLAWLAGEES